MSVGSDFFESERTHVRCYEVQGKPPFVFPHALARWTSNKKDTTAKVLPASCRQYFSPIGLPARCQQHSGGSWHGRVLRRGHMLHAVDAKRQPQSTSGSASGILEVVTYTSGRTAAADQREPRGLAGA